MAETAKPEKKKIPGGGRKGGTRFPQINLQKALEYAKRLVSKTHNGPQSEQTILVGVFNNKGAVGKIRVSALKQYGLMEGDTVGGYVSSQLAREIVGAVPEERFVLAQKAFLTPKLFKQIYDTLQPDTISRARIRQVVITANVHPDSADKCVMCFVDGAIYSGLGSLEGDNIALISAGSDVLTALIENGEDVEHPEELVGETRQEDEGKGAEPTLPPVSDGGLRQRLKNTERPVADVRVNLAVDSSSDPDKLEKQLKLLKQYGLLR